MADLFATEAQKDKEPRWADPKVTGQLIRGADRRRAWLDLVHGLQRASETSGGSLAGWVFHGTHGEAATSILDEGLRASYAEVLMEGEWVTTAGVHFGSANLAAFFAEDCIEYMEDPDIELVIFGAPLQCLATCGPFAPDGQMLDVPIHSRIRTPESEVFERWEKSQKDWQASFEILETVVVLGPVPPTLLTPFRSLVDLNAVLNPPVRRKHRM